MIEDILYYKRYHIIDCSINKIKIVGLLHVIHMPTKLNLLRELSLNDFIICIFGFNGK